MGVDNTGREVDRLAYSVRETATRLGVSPGTVWNLVYEGRLPVVRARRRVLIPAAALGNFLTIPAPSEGP